MRQSSDRFYMRLTLLLAVTYLVVYSIFTIGRYERYNATGFDVAFYSNVLWRTAHTDPMGLSIIGNNVTNWTVHIEPILFLLAPLTRVSTDPRWLLILQTIGLAVAAIAVHRIAARRFDKAWIGTLFAFLYLIYPSVGWINKFDFHPLALTTPLLLFAWDAAEQSHWRRTSVLLLLAMACKEELGFIVALFGVYWFFRSKWRGGLVWGAVGIVYGLLGFYIIFPYGQAIDWQTDVRYAWLFKGTPESWWAFVTSSDTGYKIRFLITVFISWLFLPLRRPAILFISAPMFGLALLSGRSSQSSIYHHYLADAIPFIVVATIYGMQDVLGWLTRQRLRPPRARRLLITVLMASAVTIAVIYNPFTNIPREPYAPVYGWESGANVAALQAAEPLIPPDSCLTASNNIASKYGMRQYIYVFGIGNWDQCERTLIDFADTRFVSFGVPQQLACEQFRKQAFRPVFVRDQVVIMLRNGPVNPNLVSRVEGFCAAW